MTTLVSRSPKRPSLLDPAALDRVTSNRIYARLLAEVEAEQQKLCGLAVLRCLHKPHLDLQTNRSSTTLTPPPPELVPDYKAQILERTVVAAL
jgi:hypothetical protein